ncbi:hypothetical protein FIBSPDRAFT_961199 [Athelia psychrophila]|uniref:Uncharacterized protein n=1 Tax=Athelia psychrophila TaxID=1759441 RepID=A0A166BL46_9AGAM|nr:hypothetical protein FIBSPDRAFT_961199 [Fibularhizoctonia sp. CBS 109695]
MARVSGPNAAARQEREVVKKPLNIQWPTEDGEMLYVIREELDIYVERVIELKIDAPQSQVSPKDIEFNDQFDIEMRAFRDNLVTAE